MEVHVKVFVLVVSLISTLSFAQELFLITKRSGFTPPEYSYSLKCEISKDYTAVTYSKGKVRELKNVVNPTSYTKLIPNQVQLQKYLKIASTGKLTKTVAPTDAPSSKYVGIIPGEVIDQHIKIYIFSGSGIFQNSQKEAKQALLAFGDLNCQLPN